MNQAFINLKKVLKKSYFNNLRLHLTRQTLCGVDKYAIYCEKCESSKNEILNYLASINQNLGTLENIENEHTIKSFRGEKLNDIIDHLDKVHHLNVRLFEYAKLIIFTKRGVELNFLLFGLYFLGYIHWSVLNALTLIIGLAFWGNMLDYLKPYFQKTKSIEKTYSDFYEQLIFRYYKILEQKRIYQLDNIISKPKMQEMLNFAYLVDISSDKLNAEKARLLIDAFFKGLENKSNQPINKLNAEKYNPQIIQALNEFNYRNYYKYPIEQIIEPQYKAINPKFYRSITWYLSIAIIILWFFFGDSRYNLYVLIFTAFNYLFVGYLLDFIRINRKRFTTTYSNKLNFVIRT